MIEVKRTRSNKLKDGCVKAMDVASKLGNNINIKGIISYIAKAIKIFSKAVGGAILMQAIFTLVPDFAQRFPVIYGVYDGFLQFTEFLFKYSCKFLWEANVDGMVDEWQQLFQELVNWTQKFL